MAFDKTFEVPPSKCPHCGAENDHATTSSGGPPEQGNVMICVMCAGICLYGEDLQLHEMDGKTQLELMAEGHWSEVERVQTAARLALQERRAAKRDS
jgi:hypothetical protein